MKKFESWIFPFEVAQNKPISAAGCSVDGWDTTNNSSGDVNRNKSKKISPTNYKIISKSKIKKFKDFKKDKMKEINILNKQKNQE